MDYLAELGIQRYVLRDPQPALAEQGSEAPQRDSEAPSTSSAQSADVQPVKSNEKAVEDSWASVVNDLQSVQACPNCKQSSPILGEGNQGAELVVIVDAPTTRDISEQRLLSGRDGQLLDAILASMGLDREIVYLSSIFKCPPSENYQVGPTCNDLLPRQLKLISAKRVLVFGEFAAQTVLRSNDPLSVLRSKVHESKSVGGLVGVTASITEMMANPACKAGVWTDLCRLMRA